MRNPLERFVSAFEYQKQTAGKIDLSDDINDWVAGSLVESANSPGLFDNHFMPQHFFLLPKKYNIFHLENSLDPLKNFMDQMFFGRVRASEILVKNKGSQNTVELTKSLHSTSVQKIEETYALDYKFFGYSRTIDLK